MAVTCALIVEAVSEYYGVNARDIVSARRTIPVLKPRHAAFWLSRKMTQKSLPEIGRNIGGRDHTTVLHGIRNINDQIAEQPLMLAELREIETIILSAAGVVEVIGGFTEQDYDPLNIADRLINTPLTRQMVSAQELRILANAVLNHHADDEDQTERQPEPPDIRLVEPVVDALNAFKAWQSDRYGAGEKAATTRLERSLSALKTAFENQFNHKGQTR